MQKVREWASNAHAKLADLWEKISPHRLSLYLAVALLAPTPLLLTTTAGEYLNNYLFLEPMMRLRGALGLQPTLNPEVRLILVEDRSLDKMGRMPTFAEWYEIARLLGAFGIEKIFLQGAPSLKSEVGTIASSEHFGRFITGAVVTAENENLRAEELSRVPADKLTTAVGSLAQGPKLNVAKLAMLPSAETLALSDEIGNLNVLANATMPAAYALEGNPGVVLPNMGLLSVDGLKWIEGQPVNDKGPIPLSEDATVYVDFVEKKSALALALPVTAFMKSDYTDVIDVIPDKLKERLKGARIAVLVPDAYTGARFLESPQGKVPSYLAVVSLINGTLAHRFIYRPVPYWTLVLLWLPLMFFLLRLKNTRIALGGSVGLTLFVCGIGGASLIQQGWILPCTHFMLVALPAWAVRVQHYLFQTVAEKTELSKELEIGRLVQETLLPKERSGKLGDWEYKFIYKPYRAMAGDWFQIHHSEETPTGTIALLAIGDVVGKGPSAALITAVIAGIWNNLRETWKTRQPDMTELIKSLDRTISLTFRGEQNSTLSMALIVGEKIHLTTCAAPGWMHFLRKTSEAVAVKTTPVDQLGFGMLTPDGYLTPVVTEVAPAPGDIFFAYTDGVIDSKRGRTKLIREMKSTPPNWQSPDLLDEIAQRAAEAGKEDVLPDDYTLLLIRRIES